MKTKYHTLDRNDVVVYKTVDYCSNRLSSYNGFRWPNINNGDCPTVSCKDWHPGLHCGNGLHGLLWGIGNHNLTKSESNKIRHLLLKVDKTNIVDLDDKVKFPSCQVLHQSRSISKIYNILWHYVNSYATPEYQNLFQKIFVSENEEQHLDERIHHIGEYASYNTSYIYLPNSIISFQGNFGTLVLNTYTNPCDRNLKIENPKKFKNNRIIYKDKVYRVPAPYYGQISGILNKVRPSK